MIRQLRVLGIMSLEFKMSFMQEFMERNPKGTFSNLNQGNDASTIYFSEYSDDIHNVKDYWCFTPIGFRHSCSYLLNIFKKGFGLLIGVNEKDNDVSYSFLVKDPNNFDSRLRDLGIDPLTEYSEDQFKIFMSRIG